MAERRPEAVIHDDVRDAVHVALHGSSERGGLAEKRRDEGRARTVVQLLRRTDLQHPAAFHDDQPIRHGQRFLLIVGHVDGGDPHLFLELLQLHPHHVPQPLVEIRERLVEQQDVGLIGDDASERHALTLSPRELGRVSLSEVRQLDEIENLPHPLIALGGRHPAHSQAVLDVARDGHVGEQGIALEHHADVSLFEGHVVDDAAADRDFPGCRALVPADHPQGGGLAAAAGADEKQELTVVDVESDVIDGQRVAKPLADVSDFEDRGLGGRSRGGRSATRAERFTSRVLHALLLNVDR